MIIFLDLIIIVLILILSYYIKGYDTYKAYGIFDGQDINIDIPVEDSDILKNNSYIKIDNKKEDLTITNISALKVSNLINYQTYKIESIKDLEVNEVVEVTFYYNKQRIIKKIIKLIF